MKCFLGWNQSDPDSLFPEVDPRIRIRILDPHQNEVDPKHFSLWKYCKSVEGGGVQ